MASAAGGVLFVAVAEATLDAHAEGLAGAGEASGKFGDAASAGTSFGFASDASDFASDA
jgi:hypothetical protein